MTRLDGDPVRRWSGARTTVVSVIVAAVIAWFVGGQLVRRAQAARLPAPPDLSAVSEAVRRHIEEADAAARANPASATAVGDLAIAYHASLLISHAMRIYALAERLAPGDWRWIYYRGLLHEERGEQDAALEAFSRVTAASPANGLAWFRIGEVAFKQGRTDLARQAYTRARESPVTAPFAPAGAATRSTIPVARYAELGLARLALDDTPLPAISNRAYVPPADPLLDAVVARSRHSDLLLKHAAMAARGGDRAWRAFLVRRAFEFNPTGLDVLMEMAAMLQDEGKPAEAIEILRRAEAVAPDDHHTLVQQGRVLTDLGRLDEAEAVLLRAIRIRDAAAEYNLANVLDRKGRWSDARRHYDRALAIDPFHARAMNNLGLGLAGRGQTAAALTLFERAIEAAPGNAETYSNMGVALLNSGRLPQAMAAIEQALAIDPGSADAHNNLGIAMAQQGRLEEAATQFREALKRAPNHATARRNLERIAGQ